MVPLAALFATLTDTITSIKLDDIVPMVVIVVTDGIF